MIKYVDKGIKKKKKKNERKKITKQRGDTAINK